MARTLLQLQQLITDGQPSFGIFKRIQHINYLDYHSFYLNGKPSSLWRKKLRANQFTFIQLIVPPYRICVAVGTIQWATTAFCYLFDDRTHEFALSEALLPFTYQCEFNQSPYQDAIVFHHKKMSVTIDFFSDNLQLAIDCELLTLNANLPRQSLQHLPNEPLALCSPTGKTGWTFTQKEPFANATGELTFKPSAKMHGFLANTQASASPQLFNNAIASLDWTLGYLRRTTNWYWSCINTILPSENSTGQQFTLNLAMGVNETGMTENACWLDGQIYYLPPVLFDKPKQGKLKQGKQAIWHIYHQDTGYSMVQINLTFTPIRCYQKNDRFYVIDSIFEQWIGIYHGTILVPNRKIEIDNVIGLAEDHYALW